MVGGPGADQLADSCLVQPEFPADCCLRHPLCPGLVDGSVPCTQPSHDVQLPWRMNYLRLHLRLVGRVERFRRRFGRVGVMALTVFSTAWPRSAHGR